MAAKQLLIMPPNWLGDVIMAQPAMHAFADHYAANGYSETVICGRSWLADLLPFLGLPNAGYREELPRQCDTAALFPNSFSSAWKVWRSGALRRIGFRGQWRSLLLRPGYRQKIDMMHQHHRDYFLDLAEQAGVPVDEREVRLHVPAEEISAGETLMRSHGLDPEKTVCIAPGAQFGGAKRYPSEAYAEVLGSLSAAGWQVLVLGTPAEREIGETCLHQVKTPHWNSSGETSLRQALQILAACRLLLCNDSGLMHVAAGMGRPVVGIFGATDPERTAPSGPKVKILYRPAECSPCLQRECNVAGHPCMVNVSAHAVLESCLEMLAG